MRKHSLGENAAGFDRSGVPVAQNPCGEAHVAKCRCYAVIRTAPPSLWKTYAEIFKTYPGKLVAHIAQIGCKLELFIPAADPNYAVQAK